MFPENQLRLNMSNINIIYSLCNVSCTVEKTHLYFSAHITMYGFLNGIFDFLRIIFTKAC